MQHLNSLEFLDILFAHLLLTFEVDGRQHLVSDRPSI